MDGRCRLRFDDDGFGAGDWLVRWRDLVAVGIRTTADGPVAEDVTWLFLGDDGVRELPGAWVTGEVLDGLRPHLPGWDSKKIIAAMGSTRERIVRIWHVEESRTRWNDDRAASRFAALVARLGGRPAASRDVFAELRAAWGASDRCYHDLEHLADCLRDLDGAPASGALADRVELALWYHDAVYEPSARDNEERSARLLLRDAEALVIPPGSAGEAADLVRATAHLSGPVAPGAAADLIHDIDLAIFGRDCLRFMEYEHGISEEYASRSALGFRVARGRLLARFLALPTIYRTEHFRRRYEAAARRQIASLLASRRYLSYRWFGRMLRI